MGLVLGMCSFLAICSLCGLAKIVIKLWRIRHIWRKVWIYTTLYTVGTVLLAGFMLFNVMVVLAVLNYGGFF